MVEGIRACVVIPSVRMSSRDCCGLPWCVDVGYVWRRIKIMLKHPLKLGTRLIESVQKQKPHSFMFLSELPADILIAIVSLDTPFNMVALSEASKEFQQVYKEAHKWVRIEEGDALIEKIHSIPDGGTCVVTGQHVLLDNLAVRLRLRLFAEKDARLVLCRGARILWCARGAIRGLSFHRDLSAADGAPQFPDAILCVRGLGKLTLSECAFQYTRESFNFVAFGVYVDFGAFLYMTGVKMMNIPGPCLKIVNGRVNVKRSSFIMARSAPAVVATRGFVRLYKCNAVTSPVVRDLIWLYDGAIADTVKSPFWTVAKMC